MCAARGERGGVNTMTSVGGGVRDRELAERLHQWATQRMHFLPQGPFLGQSPPTVQQLRRICKGSHQVDLWNYVIANVHSVHKARACRRGYTVRFKSDSCYDDEQHRLLALRAQLQGETSALQSEIWQLEQETERLGKEAHSTESDYQKEQEALRDMGRRTCLLHLYSQTSDNFSAALDAFSDRVEARADALLSCRKGVDTALHTREQGGEEEGEEMKRPTAVLETSTGRAVRTSCEHIAQFLHQTLQGTYSTDRSSFHFDKGQLWKQVESTLSEHHIERVVTSLEQQSQQEALLLREMTLKVNIKKDAEKLRFKYEKGGILTDTSSQPSVLQSIQQLLEENQMRHVLRFVETEKQRNAARPLVLNIERTCGKIQDLLTHHLPQLPRNAHLARQLVQCQLELVGERTAREVYREMREMLRESVGRERANREILLSLHHKIQTFQDLANSKQTLIQVVGKQNAGAKTRLTAQHVEVIDYISRTMPPHPMEMQVMAGGMKGGVVEEVNLLSSLALPYLLHVHLDRGEGVLRQCLRLKEEVDGVQHKMATQDRLASSIHLASGLTTHLDNLHELCDRVRARDQEELQQLLPTLQKRLTRAANASTQCIHIKDIVQSWWDQPGQVTTPWVERDGLTFQQWFNKWKIISTKIRQLQPPQ
ncbi:hypothetical protein ACOMHN_041014 [Nucella lapillus]